MPRPSCYLNLLTLTCWGHEKAMNSLTFLLYRSVTVSSGSFMEIADKQASVLTLHPSGLLGSLWNYYVFYLMWSGCSLGLLLSADNDGDKLAALVYIERIRKGFLVSRRLILALCFPKAVPH